MTLRARAEIRVDRNGPLTRAVQLDGLKIVALEVDHAACQPRCGARYIARVVRVLPALGGAEVDLGQQETAFLKGKGLVAGEVLPVAWVAPPVGSKRAVVRRASAEEAVGEAGGSGRPRRLCDGPDAVQRLMAQTGPVPVYDAEDAFDTLDLDSRIEACLARTVPVGTTGSLVFDRTEAAHVVDVNGTGRDLNRLALIEVAHQIRLRNLGGTILVDLAGDARKLGAGLCDAMRAATAGDSCRCEVYGISRLGWLEMTRERRGWETARLLAAPV